MDLNYFLPSPPMRQHLTIHAVVRRVTHAQLAVLPAMLPNLHIRLAGHSTYQFGGGPCIAAPTVSLIGPTSSAYQLAFGPGFRMVAVGLMPAGWQALLGIPAHECANQVLTGDALWSASRLAQLLERLYAHPLDGRHIGAVESFLGAALRCSPVRSSLRVLQTHAIDDWIEHDHTLSLDVLCDTLGVGARQLRRITDHTHGLPPKTLAMKYRALRAAHALALRPGDTQHPQVTQSLLPYADQSHAIRDFQRFIGMTPAAFGRVPGNIARDTLAGRQRAGAVRPLVLMS